MSGTGPHVLRRLGGGKSLLAVAAAARRSSSVRRPLRLDPAGLLVACTAAPGQPRT